MDFANQTFERRDPAEHLKGTTSCDTQKPDIVLASWCGKKVQMVQIYQRKGWEEVPALMDRQVHEIDSPIILQPGPAALTDGLDAIHDIINNWVRAQK